MGVIVIHDIAINANAIVTVQMMRSHVVVQTTRGEAHVSPPPDSTVEDLFRDIIQGWADALHPQGGQNVGTVR